MSARVSFGFMAIAPLFGNASPAEDRTLSVPFGFLSGHIVHHGAPLDIRPGTRPAWLSHP
jgi:hypothetical protein